MATVSGRGLTAWVRFIDRPISCGFSETALPFRHPTDDTDGHDKSSLPFHISKFHLPALPTRISSVAFILGAILVWQGISQFSHGNLITRDDWGLTDWLINYSGGFVRRGLAGSVLHWISRESGISPLLLIQSISGLCYVGLIAWFLSSAARGFSPAFLLSPVVLGFPVYQGTMIRKDCLLLLLLIACLVCLRRVNKGWIRWSIVNLLCCTGILLHETFAFFALPGLVFLIPEGTWKSISSRMALLLPSIVCLAAVTIHHGDPQTALAIHDSWASLWSTASVDPTLHQEPFATIQSIGWTREQGMEQTLGILNKGLYQPLAWLGVCIITFLLAGRFTKTVNADKPLSDWLSILAFQFLSVSPLFWVGVDYGRWIFFWIASSIIFFNFACRLPDDVTRYPLLRQSMPFAIRAVRTVPKHEWILLFFGLPVLWSIGNFINASTIGRLISEFTR